MGLYYKTFYGQAPRGLNLGRLQACLQILDFGGSECQYKH